MINDKLVFVGWMKDGKSDKVWICYYLGPTADGNEYKYVSLYGRRGKALRISRFQEPAWWHSPCPRDVASTKINSKVNKGYKEIPKDKLNEVYPEFEEDIAMSAVVAELSF